MKNQYHTLEHYISFCEPSTVKIHVGQHHRLTDYFQEASDEKKLQKREIRKQQEICKKASLSISTK